MFLMLNYTDKTQNTYIQSWTVTEIMAREVWKYKCIITAYLKFFQVGTTSISQNVLRTTLFLGLSNSLGLP